MFIGHRSPAISIASSPCGRFLASGDASGAVLLWDLASARCVAPLLAHTGPVWTLAFRWGVAPCGRWRSGGGLPLSDIHSATFTAHYPLHDIQCTISSARLPHRSVAVEEWDIALRRRFSEWKGGASTLSGQLPRDGLAVPAPAGGADCSPQELDGFLLAFLLHLLSIFSSPSTCILPPPLIPCLAVPMGPSSPPGRQTRRCSCGTSLPQPSRPRQRPSTRSLHRMALHCTALQ